MKTFVFIGLCIGWSSVALAAGAAGTSPKTAKGRKIASSSAYLLSADQTAKCRGTYKGENYSFEAKYIDKKSAQLTLTLEQNESDAISEKGTWRESGYRGLIYQSYQSKSLKFFSIENLDEKNNNFRAQIHQSSTGLAMEASCLYQ